MGKFYTAPSQTLIITSTGISPLSIAHDVLMNWKEMSEANPQLLAFVLKSIDVVWRQSWLEHKDMLDPLQKSGHFWKQLVGIVKDSLGLVDIWAALFGRC